MSEPDFDFIVIGGGSAGYAGATTAARLGLRTAVIEGGRDVGGLCILRGCMPSKTLLESGHRAEAIRHAGEFGLRAEYFGADGAAIRARKRRLIGEFADYRRGQLEDGRFEFIRGTAAFLDPHALEVRLRDGGLRRLSACAFLIATGSVVNCPPVDGLGETGFWTSDEVLDAEHIPESVCILGGGAIGLETASYYRGLGVATTVIQRSGQVLKEMDDDVAMAVAEALEKRGVVIYRGTRLTHVERTEDSKTVWFEQGGAKLAVEAVQIICALGRRPAIDGLELSNAEVPVSRGGIVANVHQQCGPAHLFAAGDACGPHEIVHIAIHQAELAARNAARVLGRLDGPLEMIDYSLKLFAVFTQPQVATVGLTEREAAEANHDFRAAKYLFADHGKAIVRGEPDGFVKLIAERRTGRLLGGACVGPEAAELIHEITVALHFGATAVDLARVPHYHPTLSEIWTYPAEELALP
jgi:pyruvate/2-oxoglutarate dehydrogenase complex dihydrolipoamide dehydrogenase (E3) component